MESLDVGQPFFYFPNKIEEKERTKRRLKEQSDGTGWHTDGAETDPDHIYVNYLIRAKP